MFGQRYDQGSRMQLSLNAINTLKKAHQDGVISKDQRDILVKMIVEKIATNQIANLINNMLGSIIKHV